MYADKVSIKGQNGPMRVFHTFTERSINQEHTGLACTMFVNLVSSKPSCVSEEER